MKNVILLLLFVCSGGFLAGQDVFRFYAPPGSLALNASYEWEAEEGIQVIVEHEGAAVPAWFIAVSAGGGSFDSRLMNNGAVSMTYQIYKEPSPSTAVLKEPPAVLTIDNVISTSDFTTEAAALEQVAWPLYVYIPDGIFTAAGVYSDTVTVSLFTGDYSTAGPHTLKDSFSLNISGRMPAVLDMYCVREPDIQSLDLTAAAADKLLATVYERSNSSTGYTVSIQSVNFTAQPSGFTSPYLRHESGPGVLEYDLKYDGIPVAGWSGGSALLTDSAGTTAPFNVAKTLAISYTGSSSLAAGDYEDILYITISAK